MVVYLMTWLEQEDGGGRGGGEGVFVRACVCLGVYGFDVDKKCLFNKVRHTSDQKKPKKKKI